MTARMAGSWNGLRFSRSKNENISFQGSSYKGPFQELTSTKLIHFPDEIKNTVFFQKVDSLSFFTDQNHFFAEKQNGPYGP